MKNGFFYRHWPGLLVFVVASFIFAGCGQDVEGENSEVNSETVTDADGDSDAGTADGETDGDGGESDGDGVGEADGESDGENDSDSDGETGDGETGDGDGETDGDSDGETSDSALKDYTVCSSNLDCPINGSECLRYVTYNRPDMEREDEIALSEIFEDLEVGEVVCSRNCSTDPTVCSDVRWPDNLGQSQPSSCVIVAAGTPPYIVESLDPFEVTVDFNEAAEGQAFGAICMPSFRYNTRRTNDFCRSCDGPTACDDGTMCYNLLTDSLRQNAAELGQSFCLQTCEEEADCPLGFTCGGDAGEEVCLPLGGSCTACVDHDENGYGTGHCGPPSARQTPYDCDDKNPLAYFNPNNPDHPFPDHCGEFDFNCDGIRDDLQLVGTEQWGSEHCTACGDTCSGPAGTSANGAFQCDTSSGPDSAQCIAACAPGWATCGTDPGDECAISMTDENYLFLENKDGDGFGVNPQFFCSLEEAALAIQNPIPKVLHPRDANDDLLLDCDDENSDIYPGAAELCDGIDNGCRGGEQGDRVEEIVIIPEVGDNFIDGTCEVDVAGVHGVCRSEGERKCTEDDDGQWDIGCTQMVFPGENVEVCDGRDNSCSGVIDDVASLDADGYGAECDVPGLLGQCSRAPGLSAWRRRCKYRFGPYLQTDRFSDPGTTGL